MVDIHCHLLYGVDDGAGSFEESYEMFEDAVAQGITDIIATPHYRRGMFPYHRENVRASYEQMSGYAKELGIRLYLGCEYHADSEMIENLKSGRVMTLAGSDYVLTEFSGGDGYGRIRGRIDELIANGYIPVMAHVERYSFFQKDVGALEEFRRMGVLIQINADSILGADGWKAKRTCAKILKNDLADIVASDCHDVYDRRNRMQKCMDHVSAKYGKGRAQRLFVACPQRILESIT